MFEILLFLDDCVNSNHLLCWIVKVLVSVFVTQNKYS